MKRGFSCRWAVHDAVSRTTATNTIGGTVLIFLDPKILLPITHTAGAAPAACGIVTRARFGCSHRQPLCDAYTRASQEPHHAPHPTATTRSPVCRTRDAGSYPHPPSAIGNPQSAIPANCDAQYNVRMVRRERRGSQGGGRCGTGRTAPAVRLFPERAAARSPIGVGVGVGTDCWRSGRQRSNCRLNCFLGPALRGRGPLR